MWQIISAYVCGMITTIEVVLFGKIVLNEKVKISKLKLLIISIGVSILYASSYLILAGVLKTVTMFLIDMLFYRYLYGISKQKSIFLSFIYIFLLIIVDTIVILFATKIFNINQYYFYNIYSGSILGSLTVCILFMMLSFMLRKIIKMLVNTELSDNIKIALYSTLTLICLLIFFYKGFSNIQINLDFIISIFVMIAFTIILFGLIRQTIENSKLTKKYDKLLEFMATYETEIEKQRILRHEIKNEFRTIRAKICDKQENKEIIEYIDEIVKDKYKVKQEEYAKFGYLPPNGIKGLCYFKVQEAEEKGINVSLNISKRIKKSSICHLTTKQQRDFGKILGVFLDNAIEASQESEKKQIGIETYVNLEKEVKMIISNTYNNQIDKTKIGKEAFSTKGKTRGHGLLLVKHLVNNNEIFELKTDIQESLYIQAITIKNIMEK